MVQNTVQGLNCFHFVHSISAAILKEGTVVPVPLNQLLMNLKKILLQGGGVGVLDIGERL